MNTGCSGNHPWVEAARPLPHLNGSCRKVTDSLMKFGYVNRPFTVELTCVILSKVLL